MSLLQSCNSSEESLQSVQCIRTEQFPFAVESIRVNVDVVLQRREVDLAAVVRPRAELHGAVLVVERKPRDVDRTRRDVEAERNPGTFAV